MKNQIVLIGIGGASSSGKSSLTALLKDIIPGCTVLHQDDFWTPLEEAPIHPVHGIPDPEGPPGAIDWPRFKEAFKRFRSTQPFVDNHPKSSESTPSPEIMKELDVSMFLRSPEHVLRKRREGREYTYSDGTVWTDPPEYWDRIAYPAYVYGHSHLFHNGDVDRGTPVDSFNLKLLDGEGTEQNLSFEDFFTSAASEILRAS